MSPVELETKLIIAAKWMFGRENSKGIGWNPAVLTSLNPDKTNPQFSLEDAEDVFAELKKRKLLVPCHFVVKTDDGEKLASGYKMNEDRKVDWIDLQSESGVLDLWISPISRYIWGAHGTAIKAFLYAVILAFIIRLLQNLADSING